MIERFIPGFNNKYLIREDGQVTSLHKNRIRVLKPDRSGEYDLVVLTEGCLIKRWSVHRLVAMVFLEYFPGLVVNHIDGDKRNNHVSNLEMVTQGQNNSHAYKIGLKKINAG